MKKTLTLIIIGILLALPASSQTSQHTLNDYPEPFVTKGVFDAQIVVGKNAATSDMIGAVDVVASLVAESEADVSLNRVSSLFTSRVGVMDVDAPKPGEEKMIVVGGPCINSVAAKLMDYPQPCNKDFSVGKAIIKYYPEHQALLVAGYDAQETLSASYVLADYEDYNLTGIEAEVTIAGQGILDIRQVN